VEPVDRQDQVGQVARPARQVLEVQADPVDQEAQAAEAEAAVPMRTAALWGKQRPLPEEEEEPVLQQATAKVEAMNGAPVVRQEMLIMGAPADLLLGPLSLEMVRVMVMAGQAVL
jgi:hypothetical protein